MAIGFDVIIGLQVLLQDIRADIFQADDALLLGHLGAHGGLLLDELGLPIHDRLLQALERRLPRMTRTTILTTKVAISGTKPFIAHRPEHFQCSTCPPAITML